ncbi:MULTISPECIES: hypothetical protein [Stutzerimonas]|jgi:hypothetical protein|uniref:Oxidase n=2 Tax=Stutzerimonas TaxID=2901164 RepID=A0A365PRT8_9GAMM|nr:MULTISPECIES: hypothetical protein [Stutzerimonas]AZZ45153.1 oxidase [Pseudomonadaceae bacterium SI-3]HAB65230.1 oxidase [Pseudomonas sp.]ANF26952.1 hypothetical protein PS273GM_18335 [Stutzerimonas stutzeri]QWV16205.1 hypothetical protein KQ248_17060 [Stutzerimonas zhaodongensis]RBA55280.1 oxidase [Stutzerimonas zhaodongensis]
MKAGKLVLIYAGLLALLAISATIAIQFPQWAMVALICAAGQALLVLFGLAQLGAHSPLVRFFALGAGFWLVFMFTLSLADLLTRGG